MTYEEAKIIKDDLESQCKIISGFANAFPRNAMGLTPDSFKVTLPYIHNRAAYNLANERLRAFNAMFVKQFKAEYAAERKARGR